MSSPPPLVLSRPDTREVGIDSKFTSTAEGWPTESVRAGSVPALVAYHCFYTTRRHRPHLVAPGTKLPLDPDFCDVFLRSCTSFATVHAVVDEMVRLLSAALARRDAIGVVQACDGLSAWLDPGRDYLLLLRPEQRAAVLAAGWQALEILLAAGEGGAAAAAAGKKARAAKGGNGRRKKGGAASAASASSAAAVDHHHHHHHGDDDFGDGLVLEDDDDDAFAAAAAIARSLPRPPLALGHPVSSLEADAATLLRDRLADAGRLVDALADAVSGARNLSLYAAREVQARLGFIAPLPPAPAVDLDREPVDPALLEKEMREFAPLWYLDPGTIAEQWTLLDHAAFAAIPLPELLGCGWDKARYEHSADAVRAYVDRFNATALWVSSEVLAQATDQGRAAMVTRLVQLAAHFRRLNNFCGVSAICMGLRRESVERLGYTWEAVPAEAVKRADELIAMIQDKEQYRRYKEALKTVPADVPAVPHLGAHTMEWTAAEMNLPDTAELFRGGPHGINFKRYRTLWTMVAPIHALQTRSYLATGVVPAPRPLILEGLAGMLRPFHFHWEGDREGAVGRLEERSHAIEPPPPTEEEMERMRLDAARANGLRSPIGKAFSFLGGGGGGDAGNGAAGGR
jgi:hypothetical protein